MDISFIIVSYNSLDYIKKCIESLFSYLSYSKKINLLWEIIIVDNDSADGSIGYLKKIREKFKNINVIQTGGNLGFCSASNMGAKSARGEFLIFLNPDTEFTSGNIEDVILFYNDNVRRNRTGVVGVKLLNSDETLQYNCRSFPTIARQFYESYFLYRIFKKSTVFGSYFLSWWDHSSIREVDWLTGAFMMVKKDLFNHIGGFDEHYFMYSEDSDLCLRLKQKGYKNYYFPFFSVKHHDSVIASKNPSKREAEIWKSRRLYFLKNYSLLHAMAVSYLYFAGILNRIALFIFLYIFCSKKRKKKAKEKLFMYIGTIKLYFKGSYK